MQIISDHHYDASGHDMHVACLIGATSLFAKGRNVWRGTLMAVFQPGEEIAQGAKAMIDDVMFKRFPKPDVVCQVSLRALPGWSPVHGGGGGVDHVVDH
jgi:metal-dependent amidase/aminoacylase/carboxypeptidase family protein